MDSKKDIADRVNAEVAIYSGAKADAVLPESKLEDIGIDSLDVIDLEMALEDEFDIELHEDLKASMTVQQVIDHVAGKVEA